MRLTYDELRSNVPLLSTVKLRHYIEATPAATIVVEMNAAGLTLVTTATVTVSETYAPAPVESGARATGVFAVLLASFVAVWM